MEVNQVEESRSIEELFASACLFSSCECVRNFVKESRLCLVTYRKQVSYKSSIQSAFYFLLPKLRKSKILTELGNYRIQTVR